MAPACKMIGKSILRVARDDGTTAFEPSALRTAANTIVTLWGVGAGGPGSALQARPCDHSMGSLTLHRWPCSTMFVVLAIAPTFMARW